MKLRTAGWVWPALALAALPKCPACLAAYFAVSTGIAISLTRAAYLRVFIVFACVTALLRLTGKNCAGKVTAVGQLRASLLRQEPGQLIAGVSGH